jgi:ATP-dependent RNA helicase RhlE
MLAEQKPMAKPEGSGKKKRKNKKSVNADIWSGCSKPN